VHGQVEQRRDAGDDRSKDVYEVGSGGDGDGDRVVHGLGLSLDGGSLILARRSRRARDGFRTAWGRRSTCSKGLESFGPGRFGTVAPGECSAPAGLKEVVRIDLALEIETRDPWTVVSVHGEIDAYTSPQLRSKLREVIDRGSLDLLIDLEGVGF